MNEDYLWDKSGEPDLEIEQLEKTLSTLRYKRPAEPLPLPATTPQQQPSRWSFRLSFSPALAIAASLLILILAGGVWLGLRRSGSTEGRNAVANVAAPQEEQRAESVVSGPRPPIGPETPGDPRVAAVNENKPKNAKPDRVMSRGKLPRRLSAPRQELVRHRQPKPSPRRDELTREGEEAKAQLIMALHIASDKLNTVQRKIQTNPGT
jgi:outer membrane biosynthesis protein TonB